VAADRTRRAPNSYTVAIIRTPLERSITHDQ
jgi:hypothetical protein